MVLTHWLIFEFQHSHLLRQILLYGRPDVVSLLTGPETVR